MVILTRAIINRSLVITTLVFVTTQQNEKIIENMVIDGKRTELIFFSEVNGGTSLLKKMKTKKCLAIIILIIIVAITCGVTLGTFYSKLGKFGGLDKKFQCVEKMPCIDMFLLLMCRI